MREILQKTLKIHMKKFILIIIQFTIAFLAMLIGICFLESMLSYRSNVTSILNPDTVQFFVSEEDYESETEDEMGDESQIQLLEQKIAGYENVGIFGSISIFIDEETNVENAIMMNDTMLNMLNMGKEVEEVRDLINYSESDVIPVIVGNGYGDLLKEKNEYTLSYIDNNGDESEITIFVKKVLDKDRKIFVGNSTDICESIENDGMFVIFPQFDKMPYEAYENNILVKGDLDEAEQIEKEFDELGISVNTSTLEEQIGEYYKKQKNIVISTLIFSVVLIMLSVLGCVGTLLANVLVRKKEFGIYYALGITSRKLKMLVLSEGIFIFGLSLVLSEIIAKLVECFILANDNMHLSLGGSLLVVVIMFICMVICEIAPIRKLNKFEPIELVNENV